LLTLSSVDYLPQPVHIQRRHAFRYIKIEVLAVSGRYGVKVENAIAHAVTSAPEENPPPLAFSSNEQRLSSDDKALLQKVDEAALLTLRNCMHTVYEDGPRRDMRLW
jgi:alpha-L-rhamnosidase